MRVDPRELLRRFKRKREGPSDEERKEAAVAVLILRAHLNSNRRERRKAGIHHSTEALRGMLRLCEAIAEGKADGAVTLDDLPPSPTPDGPVSAVVVD